MQITSKGQVTIPQEIRNRLGLLPHTKVEFELAGDHARIRKARRSSGESVRGRLALEMLRGTADTRTVERKSSAEDLFVGPPDRLEQGEVGALQPLLLGDRDQLRGARVEHLVHRVPEARDVPAGLARTSYGVEGERVPPGVVRGEVARPGLENVVQVLAAVLGHAEEP